MDQKAREAAFTAAATKIADNSNQDVLLYNADIERPRADALRELCRDASRRENVLLILCTRGGDPDAAYRMVRWLHGMYKRVTVLLCGRCKSAGTLVSIGAHDLIMTDYAELGPLDVQLGKKDELYEMDSGLTVLNALAELEEKAFEFFESALFRLKVQSEGRITLRLATQIASELAKGMMGPIMSQIDPLHVGEVSRAMAIGKQYGIRLSNSTKNLRPGALDKLVNHYPSHGFVIDCEEAKQLFVRIRPASTEESELINLLGPAASQPQTRNNEIVFFVSESRKETVSDSNNEERAGEQANPAATGAGTDAPVGGATEPQGQNVAPIGTRAA